MKEKLLYIQKLNLPTVMVTHINFKRNNLQIIYFVFGSDVTIQLSLLFGMLMAMSSQKEKKEFT